MRFNFHAKHTSGPFVTDLPSPRNMNWRNPSSDLMMPNTGSTVCLRSA